MTIGEARNVWLVEHCSCVYESAPEVVSVHQSAVGAFKAMRELRSREIEKDTWGALPHIGGFHAGNYSGPKMSKGMKNGWWLRIRKVEVKP